MGAGLLTRVFLAPPLAFARVGASATPCDAFNWASNDITPRGVGQTSLEPAKTLTIDDDGTVSASVQREILFRDENGIRPVCPFFELHGEYIDGAGIARTGPITVGLLAGWGSSPADVVWSVHLGNLKAFHYTRRVADRIDAKVSVAGNVHSRVALLGWSPDGDTEPLIRRNRPMPMGAIQVPKPDAAHPEIRLRFYAPKGHIYGPEDLVGRIEELDFDIRINAEWRAFALPVDRLIVNPNATWPRYVPSVADVGPFNERDYRNTPGGLLAAPASAIPWLPEGEIRERSLGLVDDVSDGIISCDVRVKGQTVSARARIVVGPPDFAPANRPPVSLADNLADRELRDGPRQSRWSDDDLTTIVLDIFERAFETSDLMHRDYQNWRSIRTNNNEFSEQGSRAWLDVEDLEKLLWSSPDPGSVSDGLSDGMPIVHSGTRQHRRHNAVTFLVDRMRENPQIFDEWIRRPLDPLPFYDKRMPALMRGSDGRPHHLTRRQWELVRLWITQIRAGTIAAGMPPPGEV